MMIGILSSIAIPQFQVSIDKARQKEATSLINGYIKAAQLHYLELGTKALNSGDLSAFVAVLSCEENDRNVAPNPIYCKNNTPKNIGYPMGHDSWYIPSGYYRVFMSWSNPNGEGSNIFFRATPSSEYYPQGYGVSACYNMKTEVVRVQEMNQRGSWVPIVQC